MAFLDAKRQVKEYAEEQVKQWKGVGDALAK